MSEEAPVSVLILGGLGTCGRHLVKYIVDYELATHVRVVDKAVKSMAYLGETFGPVFDAPSVEVMQANLASDDHIARAFAPSEKCPGPFQLVVNFAAETKHQQPREMYDAYITDLRAKCAAAAAAHGVDKYVEVSTAQVYAGSKDSAKEGDATAPWTTVAKCHLAAEEKVRAVAGLNSVVLRLPIVYGPGDRHGLMPRLVCARLYEETGETMELLWGPDLRIDTVHAQDVAACCWHLLVTDLAALGFGPGEVFNLSDGNATTQKKLNAELERTFKVRTGYYGFLENTAARAKLDLVVEEANEGHLEPWDDLCARHKVGYTPLSPVVDPEQLYKHHTAVDAAKIRATGFEVSCPAPTAELLLECVAYWRDLGLFP